MRYAMLLITFAALGCADQPAFQPPPGHPASAGAVSHHAPSAADPFAVRATPITPAPMPHQGHGDPAHSEHDQHRHDPEMKHTPESKTNEQPHKEHAHESQDKGGH